MISAGEAAPDFTLPNHRGEQVSLADFRGRKVMLVFYPSDFSPVCTDQLSVYQEVLDEIEGKGLALVGVSVDSTWSHRAFRKQLGIEIPLLADFHPRGEVSAAYGAYLEDWGTANRSRVADRRGRHRALGPRGAGPARNPRREHDLRRARRGRIAVRLLA